MRAPAAGEAPRSGRELPQLFGSPPPPPRKGTSLPSPRKPLPPNPRGGAGPRRRPGRREERPRARGWSRQPPPPGKKSERGRPGEESSPAPAAQLPPRPAGETADTRPRPEPAAPSSRARPGPGGARTSLTLGAWRVLWPRAASASPAPNGPRAGAAVPRGRAGPAGARRVARGSAAVTAATPLAVNRKPGKGGGAAAPQLPSGPRAPPAGLGLGLAGHRSPLRAPAGPPPPPAPPLPPRNGQRWSLNRALNHRNAICAPGPHLLPPTAARSVTPLPTGPARPPTPQPIARPLTQTAAQAPRPACSGARHWPGRGARREL